MRASQQSTVADGRSKKLAPLHASILNEGRLRLPWPKSAEKQKKSAKSRKKQQLS
jgi:hypothetical protein